MTPKARPIRVALPDGTLFTRPAGDPTGPVTCARCGARSAPDPVRDLEAFAEFAELHKGATCAKEETR